MSRGGGTAGHEQRGDRPAIIVGNDTGNRYSPVVEVVFLTSRNKKPLPTHVHIRSALKPSTALCEQITTVSKERLERRVGIATAEEMRQIDEAIAISLGTNGAAVTNSTGGTTMQIKMTTPYGEMNFDVKPARAADLMQQALQFAAEQDAEKGTTEVRIPTLAAGNTNVARNTFIEGGDGVELVVPPKRPQSRVERMFGNFKSDKTAKPEPSREPETYQGFLLIRCEECGDIKGFHAKRPTSRNTCKCGHTTELHDLKPLYLECKCGSRFKYRTNIDDEAFDYTCLNCGSLVDLELNKRGDTYVTVR